MLFTRPAPEIRDGAFESEADFGLVLGIRFEISDANSLFLAAAFTNEKDGIADFELRLEHDKSAACVDGMSFRFFVERAGVFGETVDNDRNTKIHSRAGARGFLRFGSGDTIHKAGQPAQWPVERFVHRRHFDDFFGAALLGAMLAALEIPGFPKDLLVALLTVRESDPRVGLAERAA